MLSCLKHPMAPTMRKLKKQPQKDSRSFMKKKQNAGVHRKLSRLRWGAELTHHPGKVHKPQPPTQLEARPRSGLGSGELLSLAGTPIRYDGMLFGVRRGRASWALCSIGMGSEMREDGIV